MRTRRLTAAVVDVPDTWVAVHQVPPAERHIIRDLQLEEAAGVAGGLVFVGMRNPESLIWNLLKLYEPGNLVHPWQGDVVLEEGDELVCYTVHIPVRLYVSGAVLTLGY